MVHFEVELSIYIFYSFFKNKKKDYLIKNVIVTNIFMFLFVLLFGFYLLLLGVLSGRNGLSLVMGILFCGMTSLLAFYSRGHQRIVLAGLAISLAVDTLLFVLNIHIVRFICDLLKI